MLRGIAGKGGADLIKQFLFFQVSNFDRILGSNVTIKIAYKKFLTFGEIFNESYISIFLIVENTPSVKFGASF
jgi:hypothetical protein